MSEILSQYSRWASSGPAPALMEGGLSLSYDALMDRVDQLAHRLKNGGCSSGSRLVLAGSPGRSEWVIRLLAGMAAGAAVILLDPHVSGPERRASLSALEPDFELGTSSRLERIGHRNCAATEGAGIWLFTSGTTSSPRPHFRSEAALARQAERVSRRLPGRLSETRPATLSVTPLCHGYGLLNALLMIHSVGGLVILAENAPKREIVRLIHDQAIRILYAWPAHFKQLGRRQLWPAAAENQLRWCVSSSMQLEPDVALRFEDCSGSPIRQQYGTTESGPLCVDSGEPPVGVQCVGLPFDGIEVRILDLGGRPLPKGREGRVVVRLTDAADPEWLRRGWYSPGDIGTLDEVGRLHIHHRIESFFDERKTS